MRLVDGFGYGPDAGGLTGADVGARMSDQIRYSQELASFELVDEGRD